VQRRKLRWLFGLALLMIAALSLFLASPDESSGVARFYGVDDAAPPWPYRAIWYGRKWFSAEKPFRTIIDPDGPPMRASEELEDDAEMDD
jgi:hypothetical protein